MSSNRFYASVARDRCMIARKKDNDEKRFKKRIDEKLNFLFGEIEDACDRGEFYIERNISESENDILSQVFTALSDLGYVSTLSVDEDNQQIVKISWQLS